VGKKFPKKHFLKFDDLKKMKILQQNIALLFFAFWSLRNQQEISG
jgi:hypothetical protein